MNHFTPTADPAQRFLFFDVIWNGIIWKLIFPMKLLFMCSQIQMPTLYVQQEVRSKWSVMLEFHITLPLA